MFRIYTVLTNYVNILLLLYHYIYGSQSKQRNHNTLHQKEKPWIWISIVLLVIFIQNKKKKAMQDTNSLPPSTTVGNVRATASTSTVLWQTYTYKNLYRYMYIKYHKLALLLLKKSPSWIGVTCFFPGSYHFHVRALLYSVITFIKTSQQQFLTLWRWHSCNCVTTFTTYENR